MPPLQKLAKFFIYHKCNARMSSYLSEKSHNDRNDYYMVCHIHNLWTDFHNTIIWKSTASLTLYVHKVIGLNKMNIFYRCGWILTGKWSTRKEVHALGRFMPAPKRYQKSTSVLTVPSSVKIVLILSNTAALTLEKSPSLVLSVHTKLVIDQI